MALKQSCEDIILKMLKEDIILLGNLNESIASIEAITKNSDMEIPVEEFKTISSAIGVLQDRASAIEEGIYDKIEKVVKCEQE